MPRYLIIGLLILLVLACGEDAGTETTTTTDPTSTSIATTTSSTPLATTVTTAATTTSTSSTAPEPDDLAERSGCTPGSGDLPDGEWYGLVTARDATSIDFDLACWYTGEAAVQAAAEDGEESPPPNDYYVRNVNDAIRVVPLGPDVEVTFFPDGDPTNVSEIDYQDWAGLVATRGYELGVWIEIEEGVITEVEEQWVP